MNSAGREFASHQSRRIELCPSGLRTVLMSRSVTAILGVLDFFI
jgi:hypothetical protein